MLRLVLFRMLFRDGAQNKSACPKTLTGDLGDPDRFCDSASHTDTDITIFIK